jgi:hypothetical protein
MATIQRLIVLVSLLTGAAGCASDDDRAIPLDAPALPALTGVYTCSVEVIDGYASCGGPVYLSDLSGPDQIMSVSQAAATLEAGIWGRVLAGTVEPNGAVSLVYRDTDCSVCSPTRPFVIELAGTAGERQIRNITIRMYQIGVGECEKSYRATCATN